MAKRFFRCAAHGLVLAFVLFLCPAPASATSECGQGIQCGPHPLTSQLHGFVATNTTLTYAAPGPVYDVIGDYVVNPGVTLTIEPGVTLRFAPTDDLNGGDYAPLVEIDIQGSLVADATSGDSIRFIPSADGGTWGQVKVESGATINLVKAAMSGATIALNLHGSGSKVITNALIIGGNTAIQAAGASSLAIANLVILNPTDGILAPGAAGSVRACVISGRSSGGLYYGTGLTVGSALEVAAPDTTHPEPTIISGFYQGVMLNQGATARNILVRDCFLGFTQSGGGYAATITYCTAVRNSVGFTYYAPASALNCIATFDDTGFKNGSGTNTGYADSWNNTSNYYSSGDLGPQCTSYNPFFVDPDNNDFHLASNSVFENFSNSGGEIGAYGPGTCSSTTSAGNNEAGGGNGPRALPNPTRGAVRLEYEQPASGHVTVEFLDVSGRRIRRVADAFEVVGRHRVTWDGKDEQGTAVPAGLYFWRITSATSVVTGRLVVSR